MLSQPKMARFPEEITVRHWFDPLLMILASATDKELARMVEYLKEENRILRSKLPKRIDVTPGERSRLVKLGQKLGTQLRGIIGIVSYRTFLRWVNGESQSKGKFKKRGRRRKPDEIRELIVRLARENNWGYTRILGELKKLGIHKISRNTVKNILREAGLDPGPTRGKGTWDEFIKIHASTLWACDFFTKSVWTLMGKVEIYVLFFIHVESRRVQIAGMTAHPDRDWMKQQARNISMFFAEQPIQPKYLLRDHDTKFVAEFDAILESDGITVKPVGPRAPNMNAHAERWVQTVKDECLNNVIVFGEDHLRYILKEYLTHYHEERPHQSLDNRPLNAPEESDSDKPVILPFPKRDEVVCHERLGGLLRHYTRRAA